MYWQKRFDRENPDIELEEKIHEIHKCNKDYGYRRMCGELRNQGHIVNKKKVQRIMQKYNLQVMSFTRKSRVELERLLLIESKEDLIHTYLIRRLQLIQQSLNTMK